ncbi:MAG: uroporphyrinogen-III C-methyltransferase, partial [Coriobacteriales bacterium]|nr:uroporphyrinogen-III C-methyltransferase [Coriobacteriales bacterium]
MAEGEGQAATRNGHVYLVGAGPGDPGLLTIKGRGSIAKAEILIYDRLVSPELLNHAQPGCELIDAGKTPNNHPLPQWEINALLVENALAGKTVVRLKGGDSFVFGRGGEEAEALHAQGISFEVVPGVTSAVAAPAYAGIPVTHRGLASSFTVVTGHEDPQRDESSIAWEHISKTGGTLVFLMGMEKLPLIIENLLRQGMDAQTPAAIIEWGTWPKQRTLCGDIGSLVKRAKSQGFGNPSAIVVGQVVTLRDRLQWLERKPLLGRSIVVT